MLMEWMRRCGEGFGVGAGALMGEIIRRGAEEKKSITQRRGVHEDAQRKKKKGGSLPARLEPSVAALVMIG